MSKRNLDIKNTKIPKADFSMHRTALKEALMTDYKHNFNTHNSGIKDFFKRRPFQIASSLSFAAVAGVFVFSILASPLTAQRVLAEARQANSSNEEIGRYRYSKTLFSDTLSNGSHQFTTETWEDTENGDSRSVTIDASGAIIDTFVLKDGEAYASLNVDLFMDSNSTEMTQIGPVAGQISAEEITFDEDMTSEEIEAALREQFGDVDVVFGEEQQVAVGQSIDGVSFDQESQDYSQELESDGISVVSFGGQDYARVATQSERTKLFNELLEEDNTELIESTSWAGVSAVGIRHQAFSDFVSTMYFETNTYKYLGSEASGDGVSFKEVVLEESYSDAAIDLSVEGLKKIEISTLY